MCVDCEADLLLSDTITHTLKCDAQYVGAKLIYVGICKSTVSSAELSARQLQLLDSARYHLYVSIWSIAFGT